MSKFFTTTGAIVLLTSIAALASAEAPSGPGWTPLFNGKDLSGWKLPATGQGHWKVVDGVIDYDAQGGGTLWTEKPFSDFVLHIEWRAKTPKDLYGSDKDENGKPYAYTPDSGIFLRGFSKAQTNIWLNPMGSGEVWGYRTDAKLPEEVRKAATPKLRADKPWGEWNRPGDHPEGRPAHRGAQRPDGDRQRAAAGHPGYRPHRPPAPRRLRSGHQAMAAFVGVRPVPGHLHQGRRGRQITR